MTFSAFFFSAFATRQPARAAPEPSGAELWLHAASVNAHNRAAAVLVLTAAMMPETRPEQSLQPAARA
jgi:hypothetical protein